MNLDKKIKRIKIGKIALFIAYSIMLTRCSHTSNQKTEEQLKIEEQPQPEEQVASDQLITVSNFSKTEEQLKNEIYVLQVQLKNLQKEHNEENFQVINTLENLNGVEVDYDDNGFIFYIKISRKQSEKDFITIINSLNTNSCTELKYLIFEDNDLEKFSDTTQELLKNTIKSLETKELETLELNNMNLKDISFLENTTFASSLKNLSLDDNAIEDINVLSNFTMLNLLSLNNNKISDISSLLNLNYLTNLHLNNNNIEDVDIENIKKMLKLNVLFLDGNNISDYEALQELTDDGLTIYYYNEQQQNQEETEEKKK